jgi:8-oxo-dGTP pyrophosphatase MutT (NUDIX family)
LKKYTPFLIFKEFWEELGLLKISLCWDIRPLSFIFLFPLSFLLSFFSKHPSLFLDIWIEVVVKGILGALLRNKRGLQWMKENF